jgi:hypothetical protein
MSGVGEDGRALTAKERKAIADLQALAKRWPRSLTLFSWSGSLYVFKSDEWAARGHSGPNGYDANDYEVAHVSGIPNDGGDP